MSTRSGATETHRHRLPLGLLMLEKGWITAAELRRALDAQRTAGSGRLGDWLVRGGAATEALVTKALGLQWSCPVLSLGGHNPQSLAPLMPRLFVDAFGVLPVRVAAQSIAYLAFEDRLDLALAVAVERMTGLRVETGIVEGSAFRAGQERALAARYASVSLLEAASEPALARALTKSIEAARPVEARLVRVHDFLWLRLWLKPQTGAVPSADDVRDIICSLASS